MSWSSRKQLDRPIVRYVLSAILVLLSLVAALILVRLGHDLPAFALFYPVLVMIALLFGFWAGLMSTALSAFLLAIWYFSPVGQFKIERASDWIALSLFFLTGVFINWVTENYRRNRLRLAAVSHALAFHEARQQIEESSAYRQLALEAADMGVWEYHPDTGTLVWDERCREFYGIPKGENPGLEGVLKQIPPEDHAHLVEAVSRAAKGSNGGTFQAEFRVIRPDGTAHWLASWGRVYFDGEAAPKKVTRVIGVTSDITERKQAENAVETVLQRFYRILSNLYSGVLLVTDDGQIEFANQAFCDLFDLPDSPLDLAGLDAGSVIAKIRGRYRSVEGAIARIRELVAQGNSVIGEEVPLQEGKTCVRDFVPLKVEGKSYGRLWVHTDITQMKRAEALLHRFYEMDLFAVVYWKIDGGIIDSNERFLAMSGYTREDLRAGLINVSDMTPPEYHAADEDARRQLRETGIHQSYEKEFVRKDGTRVWGQFWAAAYEDNRSEGVSFILDITERKRAEDELRNAKRDWERTFNSVPDLIAILDGQHRILRANRAMADRLGTLPGKCVGQACYECVHGIGGPMPDCPHTLTLRDGREHTTELHEDRLRGDFLVTTTPLINERGEMDGSVHVARDITARKQIENALRESEERYRNLFNAMNEGFCIIQMLFDAQGIPKDYQYLQVNPAFENLTGLHDTVGKRMRELAPIHEEYWYEIYGRVALTGEPAHFIDEAKPLGRVYDVHAYRVGVPDEHRVAVVFSDFSEFKQAEEQLQKLNRTLKALSSCNQALLHSPDEAAFLDEVCRIVTEDCGYVMVWIGFAEHDERKTVRPVAYAGHEAGYLDDFNVTWDNTPVGSGPTGMAIRTGRPTLCRNMLTDPAFVPWREEASKRGYASSLVIPLKQDDTPFGSLTVYSRIPDAFSEGEINLLTELAGDLAFGIRTLRTRAAHAEAERALRESEEKLGLFIEHAPVALAMLDTEMRYLHVSRRWKTNFALGDRDLRGLSHYEVFPELPERWKADHRCGLAGEVVRHDADCQAKPDGSVQWIRREIRPWKDREGKIGGILIFSEDITDRKQAEDALREQAELLDLSHETILVAGLDGTIRFWNHGAEEMYGYSRQHATGKKSHELLSTVFPQPRDEIKERILCEGRWEGELAQVTQDGRGMIVESRWVLQRDKDGIPIGVMELNTDITKRVRAEEAQQQAHLKLQSVLDSITDGLLTMDSGWTFSYCSEHGARILGRKPEEIVGRSAHDLFIHSEGSVFAASYQKAVESGEPVHFEEFYPEPLNMWLECHFYPSSEGLSIYFRDISERKRTEEALLRSEKLASVGRMAATIAHEINNPLAAITNTLFLAHMKADDPAAVRKYLDTADDELKRITHITRQTLGFYRETSGPAVVSVNAVLESALDLMKSRIAGKQAVIRREWKGDYTISAIAGELRQVFSNLLINSLDAIDEGGTIRLRIVRGPELLPGVRSVRVTVADNGKGIADSSKPRIFEPFFTTKGTVGTGLGLWVSKQIIDKHQGSIRMRSRVEDKDRGTVFVVVLPVESKG